MLAEVCRILGEISLQLPSRPPSRGPSRSTFRPGLSCRCLQLLEGETEVPQVSRGSNLGTQLYPAGGCWVDGCPRPALRAPFSFLWGRPALAPLADAEAPTKLL